MHIWIISLLATICFVLGYLIWLVTGTMHPGTVFCLYFSATVWSGMHFIENYRNWKNEKGK